MSPALYRVMARAGLIAQIAQIIGWLAMGRAIHRALAYAEEAVKGDISLVTNALSSARPFILIGGVVGLTGFVLLLFAVMQGGVRGPWIFRLGLAASLFYVGAPLIGIAVFGQLGFPLGLIPGMIGTVHFIGHRREYSARDTGRAGA